MTPEFEYSGFTVYRVGSEDDFAWLLKDLLGLSENRVQRVRPYFNGIGGLTIIHESNYTDKDWTSLLSLHYSTIFGQYPRFVDRLHVFKGAIGGREVVFDPVAHAKRYVGYFTVYPTRPRVIGRTHLDPSVLGRSGGFLRCEEKIHIAGHELEINGFPFSGQDAKVVSCAHIALWEIIRYYSTRYEFYGEHYQGDIAQLCEDSRWGRAIPTHGLYYPQLLAGFSALRIRPVIYGVDPSVDLLRIAKGYILSGIPVILAGARHAIVGVGMADAYDADSDIIVNDDNYFPYGTFSTNPSFCLFGSGNIEYVIVPLYSKIVLPFETAEKKSLYIEGDGQLGLVGNGVSEPLSKRTFLTSSKSYLNSITKRIEQTRYELFVRTTPLPKFVWITEFFDETKADKISAEYVIDATTSEKDLRPFLVLRYPSGFWYNSRYQRADDATEPNFIGTPDCPADWERFPGNLK